MSILHFSAGITAFTCLCAAGASVQTVAQETGLDALIARVGAGHQPTGAGVRVGQVEAPGPGYAPDITHPEFAGKSFYFHSGTPTVSAHATVVGQFYYGLVTGIAPGITDVDSWAASDWLGAGFLNGTSTIPPAIAPCKILNNSWIGSGSVLYLRKVDAAIDAQGLIICSGVNNGTGPLDVPLLSHLYNGIAVGRSDGQHHAGGTLAGYDGTGRMKPEIVAPAGATSFSTPLVSGAAALLVDTARTYPTLASNPVAERPEVIKAALLAGAHHRSGWSNGAPTSGPTRGATSTPLDALYGVDEVNVNKSHWILTGNVQPSAPSVAAAIGVAHAGWDEAAISGGQTVYWRFDIEAPKPYVSVIATWNRDVDPSLTTFTVPNCSLDLWSVDALGQLTSLVGTAPGAYFGGGNVSSTSAKDNVEHLYITDLAPGEYVLALSRTLVAPQAWNVAVAWEVACPDAVAYGTGKTTSLGAEARLDPRGIASQTVDDFDLRVSHGVPNVNGILFYGSAAGSAPFFGGTMLVATPVVRTPIVQLDANGALTLPIAIDVAMVGLDRYYQFWFRDPAQPDGTTVGLTNAVKVSFCH
jgi:hypothetical protein